jgi:hypothetical protein
MIWLQPAFARRIRPGPAKKAIVPLPPIVLHTVGAHQGDGLWLQTAYRAVGQSSDVEIAAEFKLPPAVRHQPGALF